MDVAQRQHKERDCDYNEDDVLHKISFSPEQTRSYLGLTNAAL